MRLQLSIIFSSFSLLLFGVPEVEGNPEVTELLSDLDANLLYLDQEADQELQDIQSYMNNAQSSYDHMLNMAQTSTTWENRADGAATILSEMRGMYQVAFDRSHNIKSTVSLARSRVVELALAWNDNTNAIVEAINIHREAMNYGFNNVTNNQILVLSNVVSTVKLLKLVFPESTNHVGQVVSDLNGDVHSLCIDFAHFWVTADNLLDYLDDVDGFFKQFYQNATERLKSPDHLCQSALRDMWFDLLDNRFRLTSLTNLFLYPLDQQVEVVLQQLDPDTFRLSNEGVIALENLAVNQRSYLCLAEMLNRPSGGNFVSNFVDLAWITNYLGTVQKPYYDLYNQTFGIGNSTPNVFYYEVLQPYTNLLGNALDTNNPRYYNNLRSAYRNYTSKQTNYWARIETYLMSLNGLIDMPPSLDEKDQIEMDKNNDPENLTRNIEYSTNAFTSVINDYGSVSNSLSYLMVKFRSLTNSFALPEGSWDDIIRLTPQISLGNITIDPIYFDSTYFLPIQQAVRKVFTGIWYVIFIFIGFRLVLLVVYLLGKTIAHTFLILSTLLS